MDRVYFFLKSKKGQAPIKGQGGFFSKINKRADPNKSVQGGKIFRNK